MTKQQARQSILKIQKRCEGLTGNSENDTIEKILKQLNRNQLNPRQALEDAFAILANRCQCHFDPVDPRQLWG